MTKKFGAIFVKNVFSAFFCPKTLLERLTMAIRESGVGVLQDKFLATPMWSGLMAGDRCVPKNGDARVVSVLVDTHDEHGSVSRRSSDDDLLTAALDVQFRLFEGREHARRLDHVLHAAVTPRNMRSVLPTSHAHLQSTLSF